MLQRPIDPYAYAREILLPSLGLQHHPFTITLPDPGGTASHVVRVTIERAPSLLVRFFKGAARAHRNVLALRHLERLDLPAPRLKLADTALSNRFVRRNGLPRYTTAETWIDGARAVEAEDEEATALDVARLLARYHSHSRPRWGRPEGPPEVRPYYFVTFHRLSRMIRDLVSRGVMSEEEAGEASARFRQWKGALMKLGTFHLVHNDASRCNFIVVSGKEGRTVHAIDVQRISYEPCGEEVANALYHFCRNNQGLASKFLHGYLEAATPSCRQTWERTGEFFTALNLLKRVHRRTGPTAGAEPLTGSDPRITGWKNIITSLRKPPRIWPEPGSAPPLA